MGQSESRVILITGASGGIGSAIARRCAEDGYHVALAYSSALDSGDAAVSAVVETCQTQGINATALDFDLGDYDSVSALPSRAAALGPLFGVVHCAAIFSLHPVGTRDRGLVTRYFALNATATFALAEAAAGSLPDGGRIVLFSSTGGRQAAQGTALYSATKAAVEGIARSFAHDLGHRGICVNAIAPGPTDTSMLDPRFRQLGAERSPMRRIGTPRDHAGLVSFLLSEDGRWMTGQTLFSNGGYYMV